MDTFLEVLKYVLPLGVALLAAYFILKAYLDHEMKKKKAELKKDDRQVTLPLQLQAYERLILLLERISPAQLVIRALLPGMGPYQFQTVLLQSIREEFEHNQTQQVYVSDEAWLKVKQAREELVRLINISATDGREELSANDLARHILDEWSKLDRNPIQLAIDRLKNDARELL